MRDVFLPLRQAYWQRLHKQIVLNGVQIPFYDVVPKTPTYPYIVVRQQNKTVESGKRGCEVYQAFIMLEIVTSYESQKGGRKDADTIAEQMFDLLDEDFPSPAGMYFDSTYEDSDFDQGREITQEGTTNRRFIQFRNTVSIL